MRFGRAHPAYFSTNAACCSLLATPRSLPEQCERSRVEDFGRRHVGKGVDDDEAEQRTKSGRNESRPQSAEARGNQNGRHEEQIGRIALQDRRQCDARQEGDGHGEGGDGVADCVLAAQKPALEAVETAIFARFGGQIRQKGLHRGACRTALRDSP